MIHRLLRRSIILLMLIIPYFGYAITGLVNFNLSQYNNPFPGYLFIAPVSDNYIELVDNSGMPGPYYQSNVLQNGFTLNLQNNRMTLYSQDLYNNRQFFLGLNENFQVVDSFLCNGYAPDFHEFVLLPNGHRFFLGIDVRTIDMSRYVPGGNTAASVRGYTIQEQDGAGNTVFSWSSFDHYNFTDATDDIDLRLQAFDPSHINSIAFDLDGNILISSRHLDEITKINRSTGEIIWRMGGSKCRNNQYTFFNDTRESFYGFSHQHNISILPNGHLLIFDNGNLKPTKYSRAVEYELDQSAKTVTKVWEYYKADNAFSVSMGSAQRLPNGNTLIGWGQVQSDDLVATEVTPDNSIALEITHPSIRSYRVNKYIYKMANVMQYVYGSGSYDFNDLNNQTGVTLQASNQVNGKINVERHFYLPHNFNFESAVPSSYVSNRWVVSDSGIQTISGKIKFDLSKITGVTRLFGLYHRAKEGFGNFNYIASAYNSQSNTIDADFPGTGEFIICEKILDPPQLASPNDNAENLPLKGKLVWNKYQFMTGYRLQLSLTSDFQTILDSAVIVNDTTYRYSLSNATTYFWRIKAYTDNETTPWSSPRKFTTLLSTPDLVQPGNGSFSNPIRTKLTWGSVDKATSYKIQISLTEDFKSTIEDVIEIANSHICDSLTYNKLYYWRVQSMSGSRISDWSKVFKFTTVLSAPMQVIPSDNATDQSISLKFCWNNVESASSYWLQISRDKDFYQIFKEELAVSDTFKVITGLENKKLYYWRVLAKNNDNSSLWSDTLSFQTIIPPPVLDFPLNNALNLPRSFVFKWLPVEGVNSYYIEVSKDTSFKTLTYGARNISVTEISFNPFDYDTKYFWRVYAVSDNGVKVFSEVFYFTIRKELYIDIPGCKFPENSRINLNTSLTFLWDSVVQADGYDFYLSEDSLFNKVVVNKRINSDHFYAFDKLNFYETYYWKVRAYNDKISSSWSPVFSFSTKLSFPILKNPADGDFKVKNSTVFEWDSTPGALKYNVVFSKDNFATDRLLIETHKNHTFLTDSLPSLTQFYWKCKAFNGLTESDWSDTRTFTTDNFNSVKEITQAFECYLTQNNLNSEAIITLMINDIDIITIGIYNSAGIMVRPSTTTQYFPGRNTIKIETEALAKGLYFVKIDGQKHHRILEFINN